MKILFMGTPDFAVTALRAIYEKYSADVVGVVTRIDMPKNRGHALTPPPVKVAALELGLPVYQPQNLKEENFRETLEALAPEVIVVAAYGKILPEYVLNYPKHECLCVHASYLPEYRGAAPIARAIMDGKKELGITIMYMDKGIDTGDILSREKIAFADENKGEIEAELSNLGAKMIMETLEKIENGEALPREKQDDSLSCYAEKIEKEDCKIDFTKSAEDICNQVRALAPAPYAFARIKGKSVKFVKVSVTGDVTDKSPGTVVAVSPKGAGKLLVATGEGVLSLERIIPEGKKEMSAGDFVRGRGAAEGDIFEI
ncbi:MAG: methionyl-tRNA formyltransferase [Clostridia bacterium]|nr:methionyl-tRNA formyltransferase [Clostridia bacterium]